VINLKTSRPALITLYETITNATPTGCGTEEVPDTRRAGKCTCGEERRHASGLYVLMKPTHGAIVLGQSISTGSDWAARRSTSALCFDIPYAPVERRSGECEACWASARNMRRLFQRYFRLKGAWWVWSGCAANDLYAPVSSAAANAMASPRPWTRARQLRAV